MKLFQKMLVAGTALSLLAPVASQASETVNLEEMNSYVRSEKSSKRFDSDTFQNDVKEGLAKVNSRIDGLEARQNNFEAGGFSDTTTMDGKAVFTVGALDADDSLTSLNESTIFQYMYVMNLNSSFTGDDNLYVRIKTGNGNKTSSSVKDKPFNETATGTYLSSANMNGDVLKVDKLWYSMPLGDNFTFTAGPKIENYYMHGTTPSIYKPVLKQFTLGGNASAYGASTSPGAGLTWTGDNGLAFSTNVTTQKGNSTGLLNDEGKTSWATQIGYTQPQYSVSAIVNQKYNDWEDSYFSTANGKDRTYNDKGSTNIGLRGWWRPAETGTATPSISVGFDTSETDATSNSNTTMYFVGLNWQDIFQADDRIGLAFGQPQKREDESTDPFAWEAYYSFQVNDSVNVTPAVFGGSDRNGTAGADLTGVVVETTFKF
ncbi:porin [Prochlorococcus sp. AH-736-E19]|nr:porin [Prochlorococcus sp. AH-736-E19]